MSNLVTYTQAQRLKKLGFDRWSQFSYYKNDVTFQKTPKKFTSDYSVAPTVSEALDWIREKENIPCSVHLEFEENNKEWFYYGEYGIKGDNRVYDTETFDTHSLASSALLDAVLTYLELSKEKKL